MTKTELMLLATYRDPMIPLSLICEKYFNMQIKSARDSAALNRLPVPTWRLTDSRKAPLMVRLTDLASYLDSRSDTERERWEKSQL